MPLNNFSKKRKTKNSQSRSKRQALQRNSFSDKNKLSPSVLNHFFSYKNEESVPPSAVAVAPMEAPTSNQDPRFLGKGASKMIWLMYPNQEMDQKQMPRMDKVMVNAYTSQLLNGQNGTEEEIIANRMEEQRNEFHFTRMVRAEFPGLIPQVYELVQDNYLPQPRFRYTKDRCEAVVKNNDLFHHMIGISDGLIDRGWVYLDMKPGNLGMFEGRILLIDTDPSSFYRIPRFDNPAENQRFERFYRISCHMIILLFCMNHVEEIDIEVLHDFVHTNGYTEGLFRGIYYTEPISDASIAQYNTELAISTHYPVNVTEDDIMTPKTFIRHYGNFQGDHALTRLQQIIDYEP